MLITCGKEKIEVRPWGGEESGKALLMTRDENVKRRLCNLETEAPELFERLTDEWESQSPEDDRDMVARIVDRSKVAMIIDLEIMGIGFCCYQEESDDDA